MFVNLPNLKGAYVETRIPKYLHDIFVRVRPCTGKETEQHGLYTFVLRGVNPQRVNYRIPDDLEKLKKMCKPLFC